MASKNVRTFNDVNFEADVLGSDVPVLVDFTATWCGPCKMLAPVVEKLAHGRALAGVSRVGAVGVVAEVVEVERDRRDHVHGARPARMNGDHGGEPEQVQEVSCVRDRVRVEGRRQPANHRIDHGLLVPGQEDRAILDGVFDGHLVADRKSTRLNSSH